MSNKITIVSIVVVFLLLGLSIITEGCSIPSINGKSSNEPPITPEDEGDHYPMAYEIWFYHAALTFENGQRWDALATFVYFMNKTKDGYVEGSSFIRNRLWNIETCECYDYLHFDLFPGEFKIRKNEVNLTYYNSSGQGLFPNYKFYVDDDVHNIKTDFKFHATSYPCWLAEESMNRKVPTGFNGYLSAYFIPVLEVEGNVTINGTTYNATGVAYFEHDFCDCTFGEPFTIYSLGELRRNLQLVRSYIKWYLKQAFFNRPKVNPSWYKSNDYIFGWIWNWNVFENGWSIVIFRPTILWKAGGKIPIFLYLSKDGENYIEIGYAYWRNIREKYIERADIYIPIEYEIIACKGDAELYMKYNASTGITELFKSDLMPDTKMESCTIYCCGNATGYYKDENGKVLLYGCGAAEQTRNLPKILKHRSRDIELFLPPNGLGITIKVRSHRLGFERFLKIQIRPKLEIEFYIKRIPQTY